MININQYHLIFSKNLFTSVDFIYKRKMPRIYLSHFLNLLDLLVKINSNNGRTKVERKRGGS